jgi:hypothetical protein
LAGALVDGVVDGIAGFLSAATCGALGAVVCATADVANGTAKANANAVATGVCLNMEIPSGVRLSNSHVSDAISDKSAIGWLPVV